MLYRPTARNSLCYFARKIRAFCIWSIDSNIAVSVKQNAFSLVFLPNLYQRQKSIIRNLQLQRRSRRIAASLRVPMEWLLRVRSLTSSCPPDRVSSWIHGDACARSRTTCCITPSYSVLASREPRHGLPSLAVLSRPAATQPPRRGGAASTAMTALPRAERDGQRRAEERNQLSLLE